MNGDGKLSQREVLRLLFFTTGGPSWGEHYLNWGDMNVKECKLSGINCKEGKVTKIDLRNANLCSGKYCEGIPSEIGHFSETLEILDLSGSFRSIFSLEIPSSIGKLTKLKVLDLSQNIVTSIPSEIGLLSSLQVLNLKHCRYHGPFPSALWDLQKLEKLNLIDNSFTDFQFPSAINKLTNLRELLLSRTKMKGTIPSEIGDLVHLKNLEFYGNSIVGTVPKSFENLTNLRRLDVFSNRLEGPIEFVTKIPNFEVVHLRLNRFTGTIPKDIGQLQKLAWFDLSQNDLSGEIPSSLAEIPVLKDLYLTNNLFRGPVPTSLCFKPGLNEGQDIDKPCDHILCPIGTYSDEGLAKPSEGQVCQSCGDKTTMHMGGTHCLQIGQHEYLTMFNALMNEEVWYGYLDDDDNDDNNDDDCDMDFVTCDEDGNIIGLEVPLSGISLDTGIFQ